ncbi:Ribonuclease H domain [Sesbania bispinosa]|nr:Ribonuclease H domain [Sesbania bispinosa]
MGELVGPLRSLLGGKGVFRWEERHQSVFDKIKQVMSSMHVMSPPTPRKPLRLYLAVIEQAINGLIAQEIEEQERPISQKYRHYFQAYTVEVMVKSEGIKYMLQNPSLTGRMSRWALMLSEYDIQLLYPSKLRSQSVAYMMAITPSGQEEEVKEEVRGEVLEVNACDPQGHERWKLRFDGTPANPKGGAGVVLSNDQGEIFAFSYHLGFPCTNNEAEYEALILGLRMAEDMKVKRLQIKGDSNLVIRQLKGEYGVKEQSLAVYRDEALRLLNLFEEVEAVHVPRAENKHTDALIGSKESRQEGEEVVVFKRKGQPNTAIIPTVKGYMDWRKPIAEQPAQKLSSKVTREYLELQGVLYRKSSEGLLMKCAAKKEEQEKAENLHCAICGDGGPSLYRRMQRVGMYWPKMKAYCDAIQKACENCGENREVVEVNTIERYWAHPLKDYLSSGELPPEPREAEKLKRNAERYFCKGQELFKHSHTGEILRCVEKTQQVAVMA